MDNIHHAEMTHLVRREKELERKTDELRKQFEVWKERVELAEKADRPELAEKAKNRLRKLRLEGRQIRNDLREIADQKKQLRKESKMPTGEETRRAEALLESFRQSGLVDPDEAQLERDIEEASKRDDAELEALKQKAGVGDAGSAAKSEPTDEPEPEDDLDAELRQLRQKMGVDDDKSGDEDVDLDDLEEMLSDDD